MHRGRIRTLARIREGWGRPVDRERQLQAIAASYQSPLLHLGATRSLDTRTWSDLDLNAVFAALVQTTSTLGQHALYHRMRSARDGGLVFDHRLRPGPATTRNAIALLRSHGAPDALVQRASECAVMLDAQRGATLLGR